jgi:hypothetical protein
MAPFFFLTMTIAEAHGEWDGLSLRYPIAVGDGISLRHTSMEVSACIGV